MTQEQIQTLRHIRTHLLNHPDAASKTLAAALLTHFPQSDPAHTTTPLTQPNPTTEARAFGTTPN